VSLPLKESQTIAEIADHLYSFLPGTPHPYASQTISFQGVAAIAGVGKYWSGGSKGPAVTQLLSATLERERGHFCNLITEIVRQGITYRRRKGLGRAAPGVQGLHMGRGLQAVEQNGCRRAQGRWPMGHAVGVSASSSSWLWLEACGISSASIQPH